MKLETRITHDRLRDLLTYDPNTGIFSWAVARPGTKAGTKAGASVVRGYIKIMVDGKPYPAHRLAWFYVTGQWPTNIIDHINGITSDNRFDNLREATLSQNRWNSRRAIHNTSGRKGVCFDKTITSRNKWKASIRIDGRLIHLGLFNNPDDAHEAYKRAAKQAFGEFARSE